MSALDPFVGMSLEEARAWLRARVDHGAACPACTQFAKVYKRSVGSASARALIRLYRTSGQQYAHFPSILGRKQADETKMVYWGLIEEERTLRPDGGRAGWWRVTDFGVDFVLERATIPKVARVYDGRCLELGGRPWSIVDALGKKFNYRELMDS